MLKYLTIVYEGATEVSPNEAVGALMFGLLLALASSGLCIVLQKRISNPLPLLCGLTFLAIASSMALGVGHSHYRRKEGAGQVGWTNSYETARPHRGHIRPPMPPPYGWRLLQEADADGNGQLTPEEAAQFVREADKSGKGWVDISDLDRARRNINRDQAIRVRTNASDLADQDRL